MRNGNAGGSRPKSKDGYLSITIAVLTLTIIGIIIFSARWWALEERRLGVDKINKLKKELEICRRGDDE